jgi:HD-GYP domain-containing protein (c-di-GMP phosphodiesterase class II)
MGSWITMESHTSPTTLGPDSFAAACAECGTVSHERQYVRILGRHTCEHCLLDSRKRLGGLENDPYEMFVESLAEALDLRERETGLHSKRVATNTLLLAAHHYKRVSDIGKIGVPDAILLKQGQLSDKEWQIMREHPRNGHHILQNLPFLSMAADIVLCHEERFDGSGYPAGLKGEEIPLAARLFAVIDTLDAMTFDRPYRKALSFDTAKEEILRMAGSQFDPKAVDTFLREEAALREMAAMEFPSAK